MKLGMLVRFGIIAAAIAIMIFYPEIYIGIARWFGETVSDLVFAPMFE